MKRYKGTRSVTEIKKAVLKKGWLWDQSRFDHGSDYVTFDFIYKEKDGLQWCYRVAFNAFNGTFIVKDGDKIITERSTELDNTPWYSALLDFIYIPLEDNKKVKVRA